MSRETNLEIASTECAWSTQDVRNLVQDTSHQENMKLLKFYLILLNPLN